MFDIVLVCRRPSQHPPMSFQIFIVAAAAATTTRAAAAARSRAGCTPRSAASMRRRRTSAPAATLPPPPPSAPPFLDESGESAVSDAVAVEGGAPVNHNYTMSEREDDEDCEASGGAAAAEPAADAEPSAAAEPAAAAQAAPEDHFFRKIVPLFSKKSKCPEMALSASFLFLFNLAH